MSTWAGNLIRLARHDARLSQRELARRGGTSQATLSAYEAGRKSPSLDTLARIIRAAGFDLRIQLAAADGHDEWLERYERSRAAEEVEAGRRQDRDLIATARSERNQLAASQ